MRSSTPLALLAALLAIFPACMPEAVAMDHPCIALTPAQIVRARSRAAQESWAADRVEAIVDRAERDLGAALPEFERGWWREWGHAADWGAIYPEVNHHTGAVPRPVADNALNLALGYTLTGRREFAEEAVRLLEHFAATYTFEIDHYDVGLNTATWGIPLLHSLDLVWSVTPPATRGRLEAWFLDMARHVLEHDREWLAHGWGGAYNNHYAWHKRLLAEVGLFYDRPEWVEYAIRSPMGAADLLENGLRDGGLWLESSSNYHFTTLYALAPLAQSMRNASHPFDLFTHRFRGGACLKDLFTAPLKIARSDATLFPVGDCYGSTVDLASVPLYEIGYAAYGDPHLGWIVARGRSRGTSPSDLNRLLYGADAVIAEAPPSDSQILREHGWAVLRGSSAGGGHWDSPALTLFCTWDLHGIHANQDALSYQLHGRGRALVIDSESRAPGHAFSSDVQRELNRHTLCHNTVMVDTRDQRPNPELLTLERADLTPGRQTVVLGDPSGVLYEGVTQRRALTLTDEGVTDVYEVRSDEQHTYDYLLHYPPEAVVDLGLPLSDAELGWEPAASWLRNVRASRTNEPVMAAIRLGEVHLDLEVEAEPGTEVWIADFPSSADHGSPPSTILAIRRHASTTVFRASHRVR